ncbi:hypothetical protein L6452_41063 [Arctium lappa]|uniref:Uncharacterized protein n=1 Tax=Arctium lappa TaxID=4217 RepID=A0ACB8XP64_ARCLA|nr:hypothetical protein L6452_41063 [Arctium lappa]
MVKRRRLPTEDGETSGAPLVVVCQFKVANTAAAGVHTYSCCRLRLEVCLPAVAVGSRPEVSNHLEKVAAAMVDRKRR